MEPQLLHFQEPVIGINVLFMAGTTNLHLTRVQIRRDCPYEEFLSMLRPHILAIGLPPWDRICGEIVVGNVFPTSLLSIYLCPRDLTDEKLRMLTAICAFMGNRLDHVLHRVIWYDWFAKVPIHEILPIDDSYQLIITPSAMRPWEHDRVGFLALLHQLTVHLKYHPIDVPLDIIPHYMAIALLNLFKIEDERHTIEEKTITRWFTERMGYLLQPLELPLGEDPINIVEDDLNVLSIAATTITQVAERFCRQDDQW
jgi:hypothetical protein